MLSVTVEEYMNAQLYLAAEAALSATQRRRFLEEFTRRNPHYQGAKIADILDEMSQTDAHVGTVEALIDQHRVRPEEYVVTATAIRACIYLKAGAINVTWEDVQYLVGKIKSTIVAVGNT